jgi:hypothetical protein
MIFTKARKAHEAHEAILGRNFHRAFVILRVFVMKGVT